MSLELEASVRQRDVEVTLSVPAGTTLAVLGPNGSGKSTVLGVVAGLVRPDAGRVVLDGRTLTDAAEVIVSARSLRSKIKASRARRRRWAARAWSRARPSTNAVCSRMSGS